MWPVPLAASLMMHDTSHDPVAHPSCAPPPFPFVLLCPRFCPLGVLLGSTRLLVGVLPGRVGGGGGRPTLALVPPSGSFPTGGRCMHSPSGCNSVVRAVHLYPLRTNGPAP